MTSTKCNDARVGGGNIVAFPVRSERPIRRSAVAEVTAALAALGEPARVSELHELLNITVGMPRSGVVKLLMAHGTDLRGDHSDAAVFRCVRLGKDVAWAFTPQFRQQLRACGVTPRLRGRSTAVGPTKTGSDPDLANLDGLDDDQSASS